MAEAIEQFDRLRVRADYKRPFVNAWSVLLHMAHEKAGQVELAPRPSPAAADARTEVGQGDVGMMMDIDEVKKNYAE